MYGLPHLFLLRRQWKKVFRGSYFDMSQNGWLGPTRQKSVQ